MASIPNLPRFFKWRDGRPRWEPGGRLGARLRKAGWKGRNLQDDAGTWLQLGEAIVAAEELNRQVDAWLASGTRRAPQGPKRAVRSVAALHDKWIASPKFQRLRALTQADYRRKARIFLDEFGDEPLGAIQHHHLYSWWEELYQARGHTMANGVLAVARTMLSYAPKIGWRGDNPAKGLGLETVPPRVIVWLDAEVDLFVSIARELGLDELRWFFVCALHTGQRRGDILAFDAPKVTAHRAHFRQSKRGARVSIPFTPQLAEIVAECNARREAVLARQRADHRVLSMELARHLLLCETGKPYTAAMLRKDFDRVRSIAAGEADGWALRDGDADLIRRLGSRIRPAIAERRMQDLRDTAITRLALAGCTKFEIAGVTGHELLTIDTILKHYVAVTETMATSAIDRLKGWMEEEGIAV